VDGQQRAIALSKSKHRGFPIPVNAFVADEVDLQRDQFLRVNSTKLDFCPFRSCCAAAY
jgi:hypothetical protein